MKNGQKKFTDKALTSEQAENVTGGKVTAELAGVDDKCLCKLSNGNQISGDVCLGTEVGKEVSGHPGVTVVSKQGGC
ncbi:MAG: hypothetical protein MUC49_22415 [Raineya sp.]|jgi:hypothetical protein|nr:hypothetical protein [Raineya sp.]